MVAVFWGDARRAAADRVLMRAGDGLRIPDTGIVAPTAAGEAAAEGTGVEVTVRKTRCAYLDASL